MPRPHVLPGLVSLSLLLFPALAVAQAPALPEPTISVNGTGRVERKPDFVEVSLGVDTQDPVAGVAQSAAESTMNAVLDAVKSLSLAGGSLQPGAVELSPQYDDHHDSTHLPRIIGQRAAMSLSVRTTDLGSPARIIDAALKAGGTRVDGVTFGVREVLPAREEAIRLAAGAARRKASVLAEAVGVRLGRVTNAGTSAGVYSWGPNRYANAMAQRSSAPTPEGDDQGPIVPGKVEVWAEVSITYSISEGRPRE